MRSELEKVLAEYQGLAVQLADPEFIKQSGQYVAASKRFAELSPVCERLLACKELEGRIKSAQELAAQETEPELRAMAEDERATLVAKKDQCEQQTWELFQEMNRPADKSEYLDMILELRAGAGGDEAALFARDLYEMYQKACLNHRWDTALIHENRDELGGYKEIVVEVRGKGAYEAFQYERGVHRVQRIPATEKSGRVHTSTATVAVLPVVKDVKVELNEKDLEIEFAKSSGPGGQNVNKLETAVRVKHVPTGIMVFCQSERYQRQNKEKALEILKSKLYQRELEARQQAELSQRRAQVGSGDRSEKIRTYNFPQDRITDHRINQSWKNIGRILGGGIDIIWDALRAAPPAP